MKIVSFFLALVLLCGCKDRQQTIVVDGAGPAKPADALATFELEPGFKIELLAAEPLVDDPVDMEIDEFGRVYVVEMPGYPLDKGGSGEIRMLTDTNGDGTLDKATKFATHLVLPNGVMRWKKGILVSDAPNVLYFEDTNGDGVADIKDTVLTGFSLSNPHINVNNPLYGLDNWIHLAHLGAITTRSYENIFGDKGSEITFHGHPEAAKLPKNAESRSVRFRPDQRLIETTTIRAQFGHTFDLWGHHLYGDNQNHARAEVIANHYVKRNPDLSIGDAVEGISDHGDAAEIFQITTNPERQLLSGVGTMTSASGITDYLGGLFPAPFDKNVTFICESVSNLVHADKQRDTGATYVSSRIGTPQKEFLASKDAWFRPVNTYVGPDGALYIVDYYRQIIEHPEWMSDEAVKAGGFYNGKDMGRIYRVTPTNTKGAEWVKGLKLGNASTKELVQYLSGNNIWWRMNAQRLLVDKQDKTVIPDLVAMTKNSAPEGRLHALWTLEGMESLTPEVIRQALKDPVAGIRENALKLAEMHMGNSPVLINSLLAMQNDSNAKVRFQLLLTLGSVSTSAAEQVRNKLLFRDIDDKWVQIAALSAASSQSGSLLPLVLKNYKADSPSYGSLVRRLTTMTGASGNKAAIHKLIQQATDLKNKNAWQGAVLDGLSEGLRNNKEKSAINDEQALLVKTFFDHPAGGVREGALRLLKVTGITDSALARSSVQKAAKLAADKSGSNEKRADATAFIGLKNPVLYTEELKNLIGSQEHPLIQLAALQTLSQVPDLTVSNYIVQVWSSLAPGIRDAALNTFLTGTDRMMVLINAMETNKIPKASLGWGRSHRLMEQDNDTVRNRSRALLVNNDQEKINKAFQQSLDLTGDKLKGKLVYQQNCALCHQIRGKMGIKYGPDLGTVQNWLAKDIMANILAPNLAIALGFDQWDVTLKSGEMVQGIIATETSAAINLRTAPGQEKLISRADIESLKVQNNSAMPVLTSQISHQQMADLIAFLRQSN